MSDLKNETERLLALAAAVLPAKLTFSPQKGTKSSCFQAQVWLDSFPIATIEPTDDPWFATAIAELFSAAPASATHIRALQADNDRLTAENEALRKALSAAATSLETLAQHSGTDEFLDDFQNVRGYAANRAVEARKALSSDMSRECGQ